SARSCRARWRPRSPRTPAAWSERWRGRPWIGCVLRLRPSDALLRGTHPGEAFRDAIAIQLAALEAAPQLPERLVLERLLVIQEDVRPGMKRQRPGVGIRVTPLQRFHLQRVGHDQPVESELAPQDLPQPVTGEARRERI